LYLAAVIRRQFPGFTIHYLDALYSSEEHLRCVEAINPTIYALSFASPYAAAATRLINDIKQICPTALAVCGGAHPTAAPRDVLVSSDADICCIGEGEETLLEIINSLLNGEPLGSIAGIAYRTQNQAVQINVRRPYISDLSDLPLTAWDLIAPGRYSGCRKSKGKLSMAMVASRGCLYNCTFCSNPVWRLQRPWFRTRPPADVAAEVEMLYQMGIREIYIRSDEMNADVEWAISVFDALFHLGHQDLYFQCNLRASPVPPELVASMARAGCWLCHIGIESSSPRVLKGIKKHITLPEIESALGLLKLHGIKTYGFFMCYQAWEDKGEPCYESTKEVLQTLRYAASLRLRGLLNYMSWSLATPYPGSELFQISLKHNLLVPDCDLESIRLPWDITVRLPGVSKFAMVSARFLGMFVQGSLVLCDRDSYRLHTVGGNLRHALHKLRRVIRL